MKGGAKEYRKLVRCFVVVTERSTSAGQLGRCGAVVELEAEFSRTYHDTGCVCDTWRHRYFTMWLCYVCSPKAALQRRMKVNTRKSRLDAPWILATCYEYVLWQIKTIATCIKHLAIAEENRVKGSAYPMLLDLIAVIIFGGEERKFWKSFCAICYSFLLFLRPWVKIFFSTPYSQGAGIDQSVNRQPMRWKTEIQFPTGAVMK